MPIYEKPKPLESDLQSRIIEAAQLKRWFAVKVESPSRRGMMDVYAVKNGRHVWLEVKRLNEEGRRQQKKVAREMREHGAEVYEADTFEKAMTILK